MRPIYTSAVFIVLNITAFTESSPIIGDPRTAEECASVFGDPAHWRQDESNESLDIPTIEDQIFGRDSPFPQGQCGPVEVCFGKKPNITNVVFRTIPKSGSQALSKLVKAWPGQVRCPQKKARHRSVQSTIIFSFVRHPFSRLVSGFHTILSALVRCYKESQKSEMYVNIGSECDALKQQPFWAVYEQVRNSSQPGYYFGSIIAPPNGVSQLLLHPDHHSLAFLRAVDIRTVFERFVQDVLISSPGITISSRESGRNGLEPLLHHVRSQMYFLSMKMTVKAHCPNPPHICSPTLSFVGRLEELEDHLTTFFRHFGRNNMHLAKVGAEWEKGTVLRALASSDSQSKRYNFEGGRSFEAAITSASISPKTMDTIMKYYRQDVLCFRSLNYSWSYTEQPKWHKKTVKEDTKTAVS